jgi:hypothetical protein
LFINRVNHGECFFCCVKIHAACVLITLSSALKEVGFARIEWIHISNIPLQNFLYQTFHSKISCLYLHVWVFWLSNCLLQIFMYIFGSSCFNMQCAYSQFCIHVFKNHFPNGLISHTYTNMIKSLTPLSMFSTITFCMTFFHHPS